LSAILAAPRSGLFHRLLENPGAVAGLVIMVVLIVVTIAAPVVAPHGPAEQFRQNFLTSPFQQATFPLGTHSLGRDILTRLIYGARLSLLISAVAVAFSLSIGTMLGLTAAFAGGALDVAIMRVMDVLLVFPSLLLAIVVVAILGPGLTNAMLAVAWCCCRATFGQRGARCNCRTRWCSRTPTPRSTRAARSARR